MYTAVGFTPLHSIPGDGRHERIIDFFHPRHLLELFLLLFTDDVIVSLYTICWLHVWLVVEVALNVEAHIGI